MTKPAISNCTNELSPAFTEDIDPIVLLETIDSFCRQLSENPDEQSIKTIEQTLASWVIMTMEHDGSTYWVANPLSIEKTERKRTMGQRITHLIKSGGEWKGETVRTDTLEITFRAAVPFVVAITDETKQKLDKQEIQPLLVTLVHLHTAIQTMLAHGATTVGIFEKTDAVINMNRLKAWLDDNETIGAYDVKHTLNTTDMRQVISAATLKV